MLGTIILASSDNKVVGLNNSLPWIKRVPKDLPHFKEQTMDSTLILGKNTWISIGSRPLPSRYHIIVSSTLSAPEFDNCIVVKTVSEAYKIALEKEKAIFFIGGPSIWKEALDLGLVNRVIHTLIHEQFEGDTFYSLDKIKEYSFIKIYSTTWHEPLPFISSTLEVWIK